MRFLFVDRIVDLDPGRSIQAVKNVSASEDYFVDHFPGAPIMPGALILESFIQASLLMLGAGNDFAAQPLLTRVRRAAFKRLVCPGDRMTVRCETDDRQVVRAAATVDGQPVATAILEFQRGPALPPDHPLRALYDTLRLDLSALVGEGGPA